MPCYSIRWTQAAASLQPLSIKVQLVTPKPVFEKALHQFIPESERLHSNSKVLCVFTSMHQLHVGPTAAAGLHEIYNSFSPPLWPPVT